MTRRLRWQLLCAIILTPAMLPAQQPANDVRSGRMITIRGSVDSNLKRRVDRAMQQAARIGVETLIFDLQPGPSAFGDCFDLAKSIALLGGGVKRTVGFVNPRGVDGRPGVLAGHGVLLALACDEIVIAEGAKVGALTGDRANELSKTEEQAYQEIAKIKGHGPWFAAALANPKLGVIEVDTPAGKRVLTTDKLEEFAKQARIVKQETVHAAGQPLLLDANTAKRLGLARKLATSRRDLAVAYDLPEQIAADDPLLEESQKPVMLRLEGAVDKRMYQYVLRRLKQAEAQGSNFVYLEIDSATGAEDAAENIANALKTFAARKVAWVPRQALGPATLIFLACDELVMTPQAKVGGWRLDGRGMQGAVNAALRLAQGSKYPEGVVKGLVDSSLEIVQVHNARNPGLKVCKPRDELQTEDAKKNWLNPRSVKAKGAVWTLAGEDAHSLDLAWAVAGSAEQLQAFYDHSGRIPVLQAGWVDALVDALTSTGGTVFLLVVGFTCLYVEFQIPGFGIGGLLAAISFALFFWAQYLSGMANSLEVILFLLGALFLALELFVIPGFGIAGILGIALIFASLVLASQSFAIPQSDAEAREMLTNVATLVASFVVFGGAAAALSRYFPSLPMFSRLMLAPPDAGGDGTASPAGAGRAEVADLAAENPYIDMVGRRGVAFCPLRPAGRMRLDGRFFDVVAQGEFVEAGEAVSVVEAHATRIVVRRAEADA